MCIRDRAHLVYFLDLIYNRSELSLLRLQNDIRIVSANHRKMCRKDHNIEPVYLLELFLFRSCSSGHTCQFAVHAEVVLKSDCGQG